MTAAGPHPTQAPSILARLQRGLETLYRVDTRLEIDAFVVDEGERDATAPARAPREQLLIREEHDEVAMGLYVDRAALANLEANDPARGLDQRNFGDFCLAVEGVSHFVYVALCAAADRPVSPLELELQAEVDKFACCLLVAGADPELRRRLYGEVRFAPDLDGDERDRYRTANQEASRYAEALERRFVRQLAVPALLVELRRFYRMGLAEKLGHIARHS